MSVKLDYELIRAIIRHGNSVCDGETVDPSNSEELLEVGVAKITTYIEQLSLLDIISKPSPIFGGDGSMWIGYQLSKKGRELAESDDALRHAVAELIGGQKTEISDSVISLLEECRTASINDSYKDDFLRTLEEISICFDSDCYIASIALCGKILEVCLKEILLRNGIEFHQRARLAALAEKVTSCDINEYIDPAFGSMVNIIAYNRNAVIHANERIPVPSRDQAIMVVHALRDAVRRNLTHL